MFELTVSQAESNARIVEIFGTIATGMAVAKPVQKVVTNKFGLNRVEIPKADSFIDEMNLEDSERYAKWWEYAMRMIEFLLKIELN